MRVGLVALCLLLVVGVAHAARQLKDGQLPVRGYAAVCGACHESNGYAVQRLAAREGSQRARLSRRCDLDPAALRAIVRRGILAMPPMSKVEVSDPELENIVRELTMPADCGR